MNMRKKRKQRGKFEYTDRLRLQWLIRDLAKDLEKDERDRKLKSLKNKNNA